MIGFDRGPILPDLLVPNLIIPDFILAGNLCSISSSLVASLSGFHWLTNSRPFA